MKHRMPQWLAALGIALLAFAAPAAEGPARPLDDGPYIFHANGGMRAFWVCNGLVLSEGVPPQGIVTPRCGYPHPLAMPPRTTIDDATPYRGERIVAVSDIHGQYGLLVRLLRANGIINASDGWAAGNTHMVVAGDVMDRGERVTEALWLLLDLQRQARRTGGDVHFLLGNHETMVLGGDLRYVNPKYAVVARLLGRSVPGLYAQDSVLGEWLRARPVLLKLGDTLFLHGGIAPDEVELALRIDQTNAAYRASLGKPKSEVRADPASARLYDGKQSPIWYRGYFDGRMTPEDVRALTGRLGVARIVVGHTTQKHVSSLHGGRIIAIDGGIKNGESGELLFIEAGKLSRGLLDGRRAPLPVFPATTGYED